MTRDFFPMPGRAYAARVAQPAEQGVHGRARAGLLGPPGLATSASTMAMPRPASAEEEASTLAGPGGAAAVGDGQLQPRRPRGSRPPACRRRRAAGRDARSWRPARRSPPGRPRLASSEPPCRPARSSAAAGRPTPRTRQKGTRIVTGARPALLGTVLPPRRWSSLTLIMPAHPVSNPTIRWPASHSRLGKHRRAVEVGQRLPRVVGDHRLDAELERTGRGRRAC